MIWLGACSKGLTPLIILDEGTMDHRRYIDEILSVALKYGTEGFGDNWIFQEDGAKPHTHSLNSRTVPDKFSIFHRQPNSLDLNPLDYSNWDEFAQQINWAKVKSKKTLIDKLKRSVKRIRDSVVLENWTNRLYRLSNNHGN